jgi:CelD/BcsL family acetyltransferase involved in cellulose biosynthesis
LLEEAIQVETESWKGRKGTSLSEDKAMGEFFRRYARLASEQGILRLCFMRIGGKAVAMQLATETGNGFWLLKIGHNDEFARYSPGILLMIETIRYAARAGLRTYEFLGSAQPWIRTWTQLERQCVSFRAYPFGVIGMAALAVDAAEALLNQARRKFARA